MWKEFEMELKWNAIHIDVEDEPRVNDLWPAMSYNICMVFCRPNILRLIYRAGSDAVTPRPYFLAAIHPNDLLRFNGPYPYARHLQESRSVSRILHRIKNLLVCGPDASMCYWKDPGELEEDYPWSSSFRERYPVLGESLRIPQESADYFDIPKLVDWSERMMSGIS